MIGISAGSASASVDTSDDTIRIFIVDDHPIVREGLKSLLARERDMEIAGEAATAETAIELIERCAPDVIVLDQQLPGMDGLEVCREVAERRIPARIVMLSAFLEEGSVEAAFLAGANSYVVKDVDPFELKRAIRAVARGEWLIDPKVAGAFVRRAARFTSNPAANLKHDQVQLLSLLVEGLPLAKIAQRLELNINTLHSRLKALYRKLGVRSRAEAASQAVRRGLV